MNKKRYTVIGNTVKLFPCSDKHYLEKYEED